MEPVRTDDGSWNPELAGQRAPRFGQELLGVPRSSWGAGVVVCAILRPDGVAIAIGALGLEEPAVMIELAGLVDVGLLDQRQAPLHLVVAVGARRPAGQRERPRGLGHATGGKVLPLGVLVRLLAPGAGAAAGLDGVGEAVDADPEVALAGEDVVATGIAHGPGVAPLDHARAGSLAAPGGGWVVGLVVHDVRTGDAVEAAGEERAGDVALLGPGRATAVVVVHGLVVGRHGDVDVVVLEVDAADLRVEVVARVADEAPRVGPAAEDDRGRRRGRGGRLAGALRRHAAGGAVLEDPLGRHGGVGTRLNCPRPAGLVFKVQNGCALAAVMAICRVRFCRWKLLA